MNPTLIVWFCSYSRHRFPAEVISYCVWLYYISDYRDIEKKMMLYRGVVFTC